MEYFFLLFRQINIILRLNLDHARVYATRVPSELGENSGKIRWRLAGPWDPLPVVPTANEAAPRGMTWSERVVVT